VPVIDEFCDRTGRFLFNPVTVRLIRSPDDPDLDVALQQLYEKKIPEEQRFESSDIIRWIRDDLTVRRHEYSVRPTDWFLVAKFRRRVCGFVLFHYYPKRCIAFFAYMVILNTPGVPLNAVSTSLCGMVSHLLKTRKELKACKTLLLEVDDPRTATTSKKQEECLARIRRFCTLAEMQSLSMRALDIAYRQPKLSLKDASAIERPLLLLFALARQQPLATAHVAREDVENILSFVYTDLYPEGYSAVATENDEYRAYCASLCDKAIQALPQPISSLSYSDLLSQVRNKRVKKHATRATPHMPKVDVSSKMA
jgi:hypothetical protein